MAITASLQGKIADKLIYLLTQDGQAGATINFTCGGPNTAAEPDPSLDALDWTDLARVLGLDGLTAAQAVGIALGVGVGVDVTVDPTHFCVVDILPLTGANDWFITATAAGTGRVQWRLAGPAGASTALFIINYSVPVGPV